AVTHRLPGPDRPKIHDPRVHRCDRLTGRYMGGIRLASVMCFAAGHAIQKDSGPHERPRGRTVQSLDRRAVLSMENRRSDWHRVERLAEPPHLALLRAIIAVRGMEMG